MTADADVKPPTTIEEPLPPILVFLSEARFPEELQTDVDLATSLRPAVRELTNLRGLIEALRETRRPRLQQLADRLVRTVVAAVERYPHGMQNKIFEILNMHATPCPASVYAALLTPRFDERSGRLDLAPLVHAICSSPEHETDGIVLGACPR